MKVEINTKKILNLLISHKENHVKEFQEQMNGWQEEMKQFTNDLDNWAKQGGVQKERPKEPEKPINYTSAYDELIEMINHHEGETLLLSEYDYKQIIQDQFAWTSYFLSNTTKYKK